MRPKKIILLVDSDETAGSTLAYSIHIGGGYIVLQAADSHQAVLLFAENPIDCTLVSLHGESDLRLIDQLKDLATHLPIVALGTEVDGRRESGADALLLRATTSTHEIISRLKVMTARKRGPRKAGAVRYASYPAPRLPMAELLPPRISAPVAQVARHA